MCAVRKVVFILFIVFVCTYTFVHNKNTDIRDTDIKKSSLFTVLSFIDLSKKTLDERGFEYTNESFKVPSNLDINDNIDRQTMALLLWQMLSSSKQLSSSSIPISQTIEQDHSLFWERLFKNRIPSEKDDYTNRELITKMQEAKKMFVVKKNYVDGSNKVFFVWNSSDLPFDESRFSAIFKDFYLVNDECKQAVNVMCDLGIMEGTSCTDSYTAEFRPAKTVDMMLAQDAIDKLINIEKRRTFDCININFDEGDEFDYGQINEGGVCSTFLRISDLPSLITARELEDELSTEDRVFVSTGLNNMSFYLWYNSNKLGMIGLPLEFKTALPIELYLIYHGDVDTDVNTRLQIFSYMIPANFRTEFVAFCVKTLTDKMQQNSITFNDIQVSIQDIGDSTYMINIDGLSNTKIES